MLEYAAYEEYAFVRGVFMLLTWEPLVEVVMAVYKKPLAMRDQSKRMAWISRSGWEASVRTSHES
jgi:hypothetical protein